MRSLILVLVTLIAGVLGYLAGSRSRDCGYVVTNDAEFVHLGRHAIVVLSPATVTRMFGARASELTLFYGSNRMLTNTGEEAVVRSPLLPMSRSVRALFLSGDDWTGLLVPVHALETKERILLRINLEEHEIEIGEKKILAQSKHTVAADGTLVLQP
jgi:hypothetical protein